MLSRSCIFRVLAQQTSRTHVASGWSLNHADTQSLQCIQKHEFHTRLSLAVGGQNELSNAWGDETKTGLPGTQNESRAESNTGLSSGESNTGLSSGGINTFESRSAWGFGGHTGAYFHLGAGRRSFGSSAEAGGGVDAFGGGVVLPGGGSNSSSFKNVGFIGLGNMGSRMASNLLTAGFRLVVHDRNIAAVDEMKGKGAVEGRDPAEVAAQSDVVITMLPSSPNVEDVYLGPSGILRSTYSYAKVRPVLLIDASTIDPMTTKKVATAVQRCKLAADSNPLNSQWPYPLLLDAPVSGGIGGAEKGTLTFMVGGEETALAAARPILSSMGKSIVHCGGTGSGQVAKLCNNLALAIEMAAVAEALALGQKLGIDLRVLSGIFNTSSARCWSSDTYNPVPGVLESVPSSRGYTDGFATRLMVKDISLALAAGKDAGAVIPLGAKILELYTRMIDGGAASKDFSAIYEHIYGGTGVTPFPKKTLTESPPAEAGAPSESNR